MSGMWRRSLISILIVALLLPGMAARAKRVAVLSDQNLADNGTRLNCVAD
jgi:hypothetical protein